MLRPSGIEALIDRYLLPCFFAEMAKLDYVDQELSEADKARILVLSPLNKAPIRQVKLLTKEIRKHAWTAEGMMTRPVVWTEDTQERYVLKAPYKGSFSIRRRNKAHLKYGTRLGLCDEVDQTLYKKLNESQAEEKEDEEVEVVIDRWQAWQSLHGDDLMEEIRICPEALIAESEADEQQLVVVDDDGQSFLHYFMQTRFRKAQSIEQDIEDLLSIYQYIGDVSTPSLFDQHRDNGQETPLNKVLGKEGVHPAGVAALLSLMFRYSADWRLRLQSRTFDLASIIRSSNFAEPILLYHPILSLCNSNQKEWLIEFVQQGVSLDCCDEHGNNIFHLLARENNKEFFGVLTDGNWLSDYIQLLQEPNQAGETPINLAEQLGAEEILSCFRRLDARLAVEEVAASEVEVGQAGVLSRRTGWMRLFRGSSGVVADAQLLPVLES